MAANIVAHQDFFDYLTNLPPDDETLLITKQKPVKIDGQPVLHNDGSPKYVWPAFMPKKWDGNGAWYANTGSFIIERLQKSKLSASAANCEYVLVMVLDDIGTKSKTPPLAPTWVMETSRGNYQWGYAFDPEQAPTKGDFAAAIKAIAKAGYTDGGAVNPVRNFRLPMSVNLKPGRGDFMSILTDFHPDREFTLPQILKALNVTPDEADTASYLPIALPTAQDDDILLWLSDNGFLLEPANGSGWWGVVCPNYQAHTDGNAMGRYHPLNRAYVCYHEHCTHINSAEYLKMLAAEGAPAHEHGVPQDKIAQVMAKALKKLDPPKESPFFSSPEAALRDIAQKELNRVSKDEWFDRFMYVQSEDAYFDVLGRVLISRGSFNAIFRAVPCRSINGGRRIEASIAFDEMRVAHSSQTLHALTYAAGEGVIVGRAGESVLYGNRWSDARPDVSESPDGDISLWSDLLARLVTKEAEREHVLNIMAFKLQNPGIKINHAVLHMGLEGCGKDSMWAPFIWSVCGEHLRNRGYMDGDTLTSPWGYALESEIMIINELKEPNASDRRALANKLKPIIAAPPEMLPINKKGLHPYDMANRLLVLAFSNEQIPIALPEQDRRWFIIHSQAPRMTDEEGMTLWQWYHKGGFAKIARMLYRRDVSAFNPGATPMMTDTKAMLIENSRSMSESFIVEMIRNRQGEFSKGVIGSPFHSLCDKLAGIAPQGTKVPKAALLHGLQEAGWVDLGLAASAEYPNKKHLFAAKDMCAKYTKSHLRRILEEAAAPKAVVLNMAKG